jgi:Putative metal-binding motif
MMWKWFTTKTMKLKIIILFILNYTMTSFQKSLLIPTLTITTLGVLIFGWVMMNSKWEESIETEKESFTTQQVVSVSWATETITTIDPNTCMTTEIPACKKRFWKDFDDTTCKEVTFEVDCMFYDEVSTNQQEYTELLSEYGLVWREETSIACDALLIETIIVNGYACEEADLGKTISDTNTKWMCRDNSRTCRKVMREGKEILLREKNLATRYDPTGKTEICDGRDNDCDGQIDEWYQKRTYYPDRDQDKWWNKDFPRESCLPLPGYTLKPWDCNDTVSTVYPWAWEICDGYDNNCNWTSDENLICTDEEIFANSCSQEEMEAIDKWIDRVMDTCFSEESLNKNYTLQSKSNASWHPVGYESLDWDQHLVYNTCNTTYEDNSFLRERHYQYIEENSVLQNTISNIKSLIKKYNSFDSLFDDQWNICWSKPNECYKIKRILYMYYLWWINWTPNPPNDTNDLSNLLKSLSPDPTLEVVLYFQRVWNMWWEYNSDALYREATGIYDFFSSANINRHNRKENWVNSFEIAFYEKNNHNTPVQTKIVNSSDNIMEVLDDDIDFLTEMTESYEINKIVIYNLSEWSDYYKYRSVLTTSQFNQELSLSYFLSKYLPYHYQKSDNILDARWVFWYCSLNPHQNSNEDIEKCRNASWRNWLWQLTIEYQKIRWWEKYAHKIEVDHSKLRKLLDSLKSNSFNRKNVVQYVTNNHCNKFNTYLLNNVSNVFAWTMQNKENYIKWNTVLTSLEEKINDLTQSWKIHDQNSICIAQCISANIMSYYRADQLDSPLDNFNYGSYSSTIQEQLIQWEWRCWNFANVSNYLWNVLLWDELTNFTVIQNVGYHAINWKKVSEKNYNRYLFEPQSDSCNLYPATNNQ